MVVFVRLTICLGLITSTLGAPAAGIESERAPNFEIGFQNLARRQDYNQNYKTGGTVDFSPSSSGYSVSFKGAADFVVGKGWKKGTERVITFSGSTTASGGTVLVSVYGWSTSPLVEYYIQEFTTAAASASHGTKVGTVEADGSVYDFWKQTQTNKPSIQGTKTFDQYKSIRRDKRTDGGNVTIAKHFAAWAAAGLKLGALDYQVLATEGWGNAGGESKYTIKGD